MRRAMPLVLATAWAATGCRDPKPAVPPPPPVKVPVPTATTAPTTLPSAELVAVAEAYLRDHRLFWGTCILNTPTYDGGAILTFAHTDGLAGNPHTLIVGADRKVTVVPD